MTREPAKREREWYADGLRFECTQCGRCCTGPPGYVTFTDEEAVAMAAALGLTTEAFLDRYATSDGLHRSLREVPTEHGYDCVFLDRTSIPGKAVCSIYEARPLQCRTFPWWPGNLRSERDWKRLGRECEGVGRGDFVPVEEIRIERDRQGARDGSVAR